MADTRDCGNCGEAVLFDEFLLHKQHNEQLAIPTQIFRCPECSICYTKDELDEESPIHFPEEDE